MALPYENMTTPMGMLNGLPVPGDMTQAILDKLKSFELLADDVWVVTYPKSGTTWMLQVLKLIRKGGKQDDVHINKSVPWLERNRPLDPACIIQPRGFKSHFPYDLFPCGPPNKSPCKYIYVARNPKDIAVSFYYHTKAIFFPDIDKETYWRKFINGDLEFGSYFDHVLSWWQHRHDENVLFVRYEDMKKDLVRSVTEIASFIGANISSEVIGQVAEQTQFDNMKKDPLANCPLPKFKRERLETDFMRKGIVGDWKNFLSPEQSAEMDALCASRLSPAGLEFQFD